jgi:tetratricopeptide (TPR) repeat protein
MGSGNIGSGNIGQIGNNLGYAGGNTNFSNVSGGGNYYGGGNSYGGGWGGGYGGYGGNGGYGGYGGGWASPYYGGWYQGLGSNLGSFWGGYGLGALTSYGLGSAYGAGDDYSALGDYGYGGYGDSVYGGYGYGTGSGVYDYFPTWGVSSMGDWGLDSMASTWLSSNYVNPYVSGDVGAQPAATPGVYDYSQPINVTAAPPDTGAAESTEQVFSAARDSFKAGDYQRALDLADLVIKQTPNAPVVHEFRALCLFALKRYDDAATAAYAVLSAGPCWNWTTVVGLYPDVGTYTNQLRGLEAALTNNPNSTPDRFLLAYQYLVQGNSDAAGTQFALIAKVEPKDQLSASFARALTKAKETAATPATAVAGAQPATPGGAFSVATSAALPTASATGTTPAAAPAAGTAASAKPDEAPPPPPAELIGTWKAAPSPDVTLTFALEADGAYTWNITHKGQQKQSITGRAVYVNNVLSLTQENGPPLAGKIDSKDASKFVFHLMGGGNNAPALTFIR